MQLLRRPGASPRGGGVAARRTALLQIELDVGGWRLRTLIDDDEVAQDAGIKLVLVFDLDDLERIEFEEEVDVDPGLPAVDLIGELFAPDEFFTKAMTMGTHARGCGDVEYNDNYCVPRPSSKLASYEDTVQYQIPLVEQMIIDECALEFAYEGKRFYDLMRIALRRNDPAYLADAVARRNGKLDDALREKLMDKKNWYLPLR